MAIELSDEIKATVNGALISGHPISFAAVTPDCAPTVSFRGSVLTDGDDALLVWFRNPESATAAGLSEHDQVVLTWSDMSQHSFLQFRGRARRDDDAATRNRLYDGMPAPERDRDPDKKGFAVRVQLDMVGGRFSGEMLMMTR
jgi:hypothetical protein